MIAIFTTKTLHHIFFENQIYKKYNDIINICETSIIKPKFKTKTIFERKRDEFEKNYCFKKKKINFISKNYNVKNINDNEVLKILKKNDIKYILVFGTRKINKKILKKYKNKIFNFHGGNPEEYRGLDSHYWSIYHNNFKLHACLHKINERLDRGKIIFIRKIKIEKKTKIYQLRLLNTLCCIQMAQKLIKLIKNKKKIPSKRQKKIGRYYSFMPKEIKMLLEKKFIKRK
jgi:methionyl-tRNA formyltransferase